MSDVSAQTASQAEARKLLDRAGIEATYQHIELLKRKQDQLRTAQLAAEDQLLHQLGRAYREGELAEIELALVYRAYAAVALTGHAKRFLGAVGVSHARLQGVLRYAHRNAPNMPDGTWRGPWPASEDAPLPARGACVVYVLYDAMNDPCYVGSTSQLRYRLRGHEKDGKAFSWWTAFACEDREAAYRLEEKLLSEYKPYLNKKQGR